MNEWVKRYTREGGRERERATFRLLHRAVRTLVIALDKPSPRSLFVEDTSQLSVVCTLGEVAEAELWLDVSLCRELIVGQFLPRRVSTFFNPFTPRDCFWDTKYLMQKDFQYLQMVASSTQQEEKIGKILFFLQRKFLFSRAAILPTVKTDQRDQLCVLSMGRWVLMG